MFLIRDECQGWLRFENLAEAVSVHQLSEVQETLVEVDRALERGLTAVGVVSYEAARALDPALVTKELQDFPLMWWGFFHTVKRVDDPQADRPVHPSGPSAVPGPWAPRISKSDYVRSLDQIRDGIEAGDYYQVNSTFQVQLSSIPSPLTFKSPGIRRRQRPRPPDSFWICVTPKAIISVP